MNRCLIIFLFLFCLPICKAANAQLPFGVWYGYANPALRSSTNNYLIELFIFKDKGRQIKGQLNYFFKHTNRSITLVGSHNPTSHSVSFKNIQLTYHGSLIGLEVDCTMDLSLTYIDSKINPVLKGHFYNIIEENRLTCKDVLVYLSQGKEKFNADSVLAVINNKKNETTNWQPENEPTPEVITKHSTIDTLTTGSVLKNEFLKREKKILNEIFFKEDSIKLHFYDNGEIDGDTISVWVNQKLFIEKKRLGSKPIELKLSTTQWGQGDIEISMFAHNLGKHPPNTALMIVTDGNKQHKLFMNSNLSQTATLILKRKSKP